MDFVDKESSLTLLAFRVVCSTAYLLADRIVD